VRVLENRNVEPICRPTVNNHSDNSNGSDDNVINGKNNENI
jgi:hypothetical protein